MVNQEAGLAAAPPWHCSPHWLCGFGVSASETTVVTVEVLLVGVALLVWVILREYARATTVLVSATERKAVHKFQLVYLPPFLLATFADWVQGPYQYKIYTQYGFNEQQIGRLYICGFGSSLVFGTAIAASADTYGRKANCLCYCLVYSLSCLTKNSSNYHLLMVGRVLGGIATSILFATFEAWCVTAYREDPARAAIGAAGLDTVFVNSVFFNAFVAILSSLFGEAVVQMNGNDLVAVFNCVPIVLFGCALLISFTWQENYGQRPAPPHAVAPKGGEATGAAPARDATGETQPLLLAPTRSEDDSGSHGPDEGAGVGLWLLSTGSSDADASPPTPSSAKYHQSPPVARDTDAPAPSSRVRASSEAGAAADGARPGSSSSSSSSNGRGKMSAGLTACCGAAEHIFAERRLLSLGMMGAFVEATLYVFIFLWTPCLEHAATATATHLAQQQQQRRQQQQQLVQLEEHGDIGDVAQMFEVVDQPLRHGLIFGAFMTWNMLGAQLAKTLLSSGAGGVRGARGSSSCYLKLRPEQLMFGLIVCCGLTLSTPIFVSGRFDVLLVSFCFFEAYIGAYFPLMSILRADNLNDEQRAALTSVFRVPLNATVCLVLINAGEMSLKSQFSLCVFFLGVAACCQRAFSCERAKHLRECQGRGPS